MTPTTKAIAGIATAATLGTGTVLYQVNEPSEFTTHIGGSATVPHDIAVAWNVDGNVDFDGACHVTPDNIPEVKAGDIWFVPRAYTAELCNYNSTSLPSIAIMAWDNTSEFVGDKEIPNALTVTTGGAYGKAVDFYKEASRLGDSMAYLANDVIAVNNARLEAGRAPYSAEQVEQVLEATGTDYTIEGRYYGKKINLAKAIELATAATSTPWMSGVNYLLLGD